MLAKEEYDARLAESHWWWRARAHRLDALLARHLYLQPEPRRILDIGCGTGAYLPVLAQYGEVTGFDTSAQALDLCPAKYDVKFGNAYSLPLASGSADIAVALDLLEHLDDDAAALSEAKRVLKPEGLMIVAVPAMPSLWSAHDERLEHRRRYTKLALDSLMHECGFEVLEISYAMGLLYPGTWLHRRLARQPSNGTPEGFGLPSWANAALLTLCKAETELRLNMPFGSSLFAVGRA